MATVRRGLIVGAALAAGLVALVLGARKANARELEAEGKLPPPEVPPEEPSPPDAPAHVQDAVAPRTEFPWMAFSSRTRDIQVLINQWRFIVGNETYIAEDGILGPQTCAAWWEWYRGNEVNSIAPPRSCNAYGG